MQVRHAISVDHFERLLLSGEVARRGAIRDPHISVPRDQTVVTADGRHVTCEPTRLNLHETARRTYDCEKDQSSVWGPLYRKLGLVQFTHVETCTKASAEQLDVTDAFEWHGGISRASRSYSAIGTDGGLTRHGRGWEVRMAGLGFGIRGGAERIMRRELPKADALLDGILEDAGEASSTPDTAERRDDGAGDTP